MKAESLAPKVNVHNPLIKIGLRLLSVRVPRQFPSDLKRVYCPSPKLPTRISPLNRPKANDARVTIDGKRRVVDTSAGAAAKYKRPRVSVSQSLDSRNGSRAMGGLSRRSLA
jgi:hypothetical protein